MKPSLNESPSEKEGKSRRLTKVQVDQHASMKVPPKRKGNGAFRVESAATDGCLNESPSEKEGKFPLAVTEDGGIWSASMKVPPKRKGNG